MRIGIIPGALREAINFDMLTKMVSDAESDGFDSFWFLHLPAGGFDALTAISVVGRQSSRIELGTAVVPVYARHPLVMAQHALTAQSATGGRLTLGLGLTHRPVVEGMMGLSFDKPANYMREFLSVLQPLVTEGSVDFKGDLFSVRARLSVIEGTPFPIMTAALGPVMLRMAGEMTDGTITWMAGHKTIESHIVPRITRAAENAGRPRPRVASAIPIAVTNDAPAGREKADADFSGYGRLEVYRRMLDIEGAEGPGNIAIVGNESEVESQLRSLADAGVTDFIGIIFPVGDDEAASRSRTYDLLKNLVGKM